MSTEQSTYQGWTNYETWGVALVLDNDQGTYEMVRETAARLLAQVAENENVKSGVWTEEEALRFNLADWLKDFTEELCGFDSELSESAQPSMMASQLIGSALVEVNFEEIADHYLSES